MSLPPPGYNPGESLLQGGTANIHPVQGGGGLEDVSLLQGGNSAVIHPVQGGGEPPQVGKPGVPPKDDKAREDYVEPPLEPKGDLVDYSGNLEELQKGYISLMKDSVWKRYNKLAPNAVEYAKILTKDNCPQKLQAAVEPTKGQAGFDRLVVLLPKLTRKIVVIPPVSGSVTRFKKYKRFIEETITDDMDKKEIAILFAPPFYAYLPAEPVPAEDQTSATNRKLLASILKLKQEYSLLYVMCEPTMGNRRVGCSLLESSGIATTPLVNMLEPTYVVYPYPRNLAVKKVIGGTDMLQYEVGGFFFSAAAEDEFILPASNIPSRLASLSEYIKRGLKDSLAFPPNVKVEDRLNLMPPYEMVRFLGAGKEMFDDVLTDTNHKIKIITIRRNLKEIENFFSPVLNDMFQPINEDYLDLENVGYVKIPLAARIYSFRVPHKNNRVEQDWKAGRFTIDEAEFINEMKLRQSILEEVFQEEDWKEKLAEFLRLLTVGKCYTDYGLLTKSECEKVRDFLEALHNYYILHDERIASLEEKEEMAKDNEINLQKNTLRARFEQAEQRTKDLENSWKNRLNNVVVKVKAMGIDPTLDISSIGASPFKDGTLKPDGLPVGSAVPDVPSGAVVLNTDDTINSEASETSSTAAPIDVNKNVDSDSTQTGGAGPGTELGGVVVIENAENPRIKTGRVLTIHKLSGQAQYATFNINAENNDIARKIIDDKINEFKIKYPGYIFIQ